MGLRAAEPRRQPWFGVGIALSGQTAPYSALRHRFWSGSLRLKRLMSSHDKGDKRQSAFLPPLKADRSHHCAGSSHLARNGPVGIHVASGKSEPCVTPFNAKSTFFKSPVPA